MPIPHHPPFKSVEIVIRWEDKIGQGTKTFANVQELAEFLRDNPAFAEALKYVSKHLQQNKP